MSNYGIATGNSANDLLQAFKNTVGTQQVSSEAVTLVDVSGNPISASNPVAVAVGNFPAQQQVIGAQQALSGNLTAVGQQVQFTLAGQYANVTFQLAGTWNATVQFEASNDGVNYTTINALQAGNNVVYQAVTGSGFDDVWRCTTAGFGFVRVRCTAYTSGTVIVTAFATVETSGVFLNFPLPPGTNAIGSVAVNAETFGTFGYLAGTVNSAAAIAVTGKMVTVRILAVNADCAFNLNGGPTVTVRQYSGFSWSPRSPVANPTLNWINGTFDYLIETA